MMQLIKLISNLFTTKKIIISQLYIEKGQSVLYIDIFDKKHKKVSECTLNYYKDLLRYYNIIDIRIDYDSNIDTKTYPKDIVKILYKKGIYDDAMDFLG